MNHYALLSRFNAWANERLYAACEQLDDAAYFADRKAFFRSIHGTLNHKLVVDRLWLGRIEGVDSGIGSLAQVLYPERAALRAARRVEDRRLIGLVADMTPQTLTRPLHYHFMSGAAAETRVDLILLTLFNHQTHHRGQVHNMLSQAGATTPELDLVDYLDDEKQG